MLHGLWGVFVGFRGVMRRMGMMLRARGEFCLSFRVMPCLLSAVQYAAFRRDVEEVEQFLSVLWWL